MACCWGSGDVKRNKMINKELATERKNMGRTVKLLLLGACGVGKSTIAKQMKIIHLDGFSDEEKASYKTAISNNVLTSMRTLIHQCSRFNYNYQYKANERRAQKVLDIPRDQDPVVTPELGEDVASLWQDQAIKDTFVRSNEYQLNDCTTYYFDNIARISQPGYLPTEQDVLRSRVKTTGVLESTFDVDNIIFRLVDCGGTRSERRKWIHCFEDVTAIIFVASLSDYDLRLYEDNETNRMHESLELFRELCSTKWFPNTSLILFLNKKDIFEEKIKHVPLTVCFPDYVSSSTDVAEAGKNYIRDRFLELNAYKPRHVYTHFTCATDTNNIMVVFNAVRDIILTQTYYGLGM